MAQNLNRNGSFIQRRKMYVQFPFHNLQSNVPIDWNTPEDMSPLKTKEYYEQAYIKNVYNQRLNKKIQDKYKTPIDTFRAIPNEITQQKDRDALTKQLQQFNNSRVVSPNALNINTPDIPINSYKSQPELPNQLQQRKIDIPRGGQDHSFNTYQHNPQGLQQERYASLQKQQDPYSVQKNFNKGLMNSYRRYANRSPDSPDYHPFRNLLPDKLSQFLRERAREDRKSVLRASISHSKNLPNP